MDKINKKVSVAIFGAGAIGGFIASLLWRKNIDVVCIDTQPSVELINAKGINLESEKFGKFTAHPKVGTVLNIAPDFLFVTVKAVSLPFILEAIPKNLLSETIIIPLLNGLEHFNFLRQNLSPRTIAAMIGGIEARKEAEALKVFDQNVHIEIAADDKDFQKKLPEVSSLLSGLGVNVQILEKEAEVIWGKLVRLNAIASMTAAYNEPLGEIRSNPEKREDLVSCVEEAVLIAQREGVNIDSKEVMRQIDNLPAELTTSFQRDVALGRPSEIEAITGAVLRQGQKYEVLCPIILKTHGLIQKRINRI